MRGSIAIFLLVLVVGSSTGQGVLGPDWTKNLMENINRLTSGIQNNVQHVSQQIQDSVQGRLAEIDRLNKETAQKIGKMGQRTVTLGNQSSTILINGNGGVSRTIFSGQGPNGEPYFRDIEEHVVGNILHHTERDYNPATKSMDEIKWTLDLSVPGAKPVVV